MNWVNTGTGTGTGTEREDVYMVWFGHSGMGPAYADKWECENPEYHTMRDIEKQCEGETITHMLLRYSIPLKLDKLAPNLTHLRLHLVEEESFSQFQRLANLIALEVLKAHNNNLERSGIPDVFGKMESLRVLDLHRCKITNLPLSLAKLVKLEDLDLNQNELSNDAIQFACGSLPWLKKLNIGWNKITSLPTSISKMEKLQVLELSGNDLSSFGLPDDIFPCLISLKDLKISGVNITTLPSSVGSLDKLEMLDISGNGFTTLPVCLQNLIALTDLNLSRNRSLQSVDREIVNLPNLKQLNVSDLYSVRIPPGIVRSKGFSAMKKYYGL